MGLKQWHWGKIVILWLLVPVVYLPIWVVLVMSIESATLIFNIDPPLTVSRLGVSIAAGMIPLAAVMITTWAWLTGKHLPSNSN